MIVRSGSRVRAAVAATAAAGAATLALLAAPAATAAPLPGPEESVPAQTETEPSGDWAPADSAAIHPGVQTVTNEASCTSNFIFTAGDRVFIGQAAHCAGTGDATETNGCDSGTLGLGTPVTLLASDGTERTGTLAYSSWIAMQDNGETDENACMFNDFALVEIDPADVADVNPSIPVFGGPEGVDTDGVPAGEQVFSYGNSPLRLGITQLSPKVGVSAGDTGEGWSHQVFTVTPGVPGDSGSAYLDSDGDGFGVLSTLNLAPLPASNGVSDLAMALEYASANGGLGDIELALGTEPFDPNPAGVLATDLAPPAGPPAA